MITLYTLERSRSDRVVWMLRLLQLEYTEEHYPRNPKTGLACKELQAIHPSKKSPILRDGELLIAESGLIIEYLIETYGKDSEFAPKSKQESLHIQYGIMACESNIMIAGMQLYINSIARQKMPWGISFLVGKVLDQIEKGYARNEANLCLRNLQDIVNANGGYYSNGHLSGADIMYHFTTGMFMGAKIVPNFEELYPDLVAYHKRVEQRIEAAPQPKVKLIDHTKASASL